jgi:predicted Zn-dependent peptidase
MRLTTLITAGALAVTLTAPAVAQQKEAPPQGGTPKNFNLPERRSFTLPNGLEVTLVPYGEVPKTTIELMVRAGNVNEGPTEVWLADLTGDLMREGTTTRTAEQIAQQTASMGGALTIQVQMDQTDVAGEVLADHAAEFVRLLADVVKNPRFPESELARLKANRLRQLSIAKTQPQQMALEKFRQVVYGNHPYGRIFPTEQMLQGYTLDQVRGFYQKNFGAARSHLYVAGRFDAGDVERAIRSAFGDWTRGTPSNTPAPSPKSDRAVYVVDRPGAVQSTIYMGLPVADPSSKEYQALRVTDALLGGSFGSRITSNIRENKGYTYSPFSQVSVRPKDAYWAEAADVTTNVTGASLKEIFYEIDRLRKEPPSAEELRGIQNYLAGIFVLQNSSRQGIINQLEFAEVHGLGDDYLGSVVPAVMAVTPADVQRIMQTYLDPAKMTIVVVGDEKQIAEQVAPYGKILQ